MKDVLPDTPRKPVGAKANQQRLRRQPTCPAARPHSLEDICGEGNDVLVPALRIEEAYELFCPQRNGVLKVAITI